MILISIAKNQILQAENWQKQGHSYIGGILNIKSNKLIKKVNFYKNKLGIKFCINKKKYITILNEISK